jgi:5-methylcytosine-specific restriction endonuclease McrA
VQRTKEWRARDPQRALKSRQKHYAANKDKIVQAVIDWNEANPGGQCARSRNYRARLYAAEGSHTLQEIEALYAAQGGVCIYCKKPLGTKYHADHIVPLSRGGSNWISNIQLTCGPCNNHKRAADPVEFAKRRNQR